MKTPLFGQNELVALALLCLVLFFSSSVVVVNCSNGSANQLEEEVSITLWKETAQNEQRTIPNEQKTMPSEPSEKVEPAPTPVNPVTTQRESLPRDRNESVLDSDVNIE